MKFHETDLRFTLLPARCKSNILFDGIKQSLFVVLKLVKWVFLKLINMSDQQKIFVDFVTEHASCVSGFAFTSESKKLNLKNMFHPLLHEMKDITLKNQDYTNLMRYCQFIVFYTYHPGAGWLLKAYDFKNNTDALLDHYNNLRGWDQRFKDDILKIFLDIKENPGEVSEMKNLKTKK